MAKSKIQTFQLNSCSAYESSITYEHETQAKRVCIFQQNHITCRQLSMFETPVMFAGYDSLRHVDIKTPPCS